MSVVTTNHAGQARALARPEVPAVPEVLVLGGSRTVGHVSGWARELGYGCANRPHAQLACLVAEEDVLDGFCTPREAQILQHARTLGLNCLLPGEAHDFLTGHQQQ